MSKKRQQQQAKLIVMEQYLMSVLAEDDKINFTPVSPELEEQWKNEWKMREELKKVVLPQATGLTVKL